MPSKGPTTTTPASAPFDESFFHTFDYVFINISVVYNIINTVLKSLFNVWLIAKIWQRDKQFSGFFFKLNLVPFAVEFPLSILCMLWDWVFQESEVVYEVILLLRWYLDAMHGIVEGFMMVNRFTAVVFWLYYDRIWSTLNFGLLVAIVVAYPFVLHAYLLVHDFPCIWFIIDPSCPVPDPTDAKWLLKHPSFTAQIINTFSNIAIFSVSLCLGVAVVVWRHKQQSPSQRSPASEARLLYVCIVAVVLNLVTTGSEYAMIVLQFFCLDGRDMAIMYIIANIIYAIVGLGNDLGLGFLLPVMEWLFYEGILIPK